MKRLLAWLLAFLCCLSSATAETGLDDWLQLNHKEIRAAIRKTEYASCPLYQPGDSDTGEVLDKRLIDQLPYFPVVAVKNDQPVLLMMRRDGKAWTVDTVSTTALVRDGLVLEALYAYANPEEGEVHMYFDFRQEDEAYNDRKLTIIAREKSGVRVDRFSSVEDNPSAEMLYATVADVAFNRGYRFYYWYGGTNARMDYGVELYEDASTGDLALFDLAQIPLNIFDTMAECTVSETMMYQFPSDHSATLAYLPQGTVILREQCSYGFEVREWVLVAHDGVLGYVRTADIPELTAKE